MYVQLGILRQHSPKSKNKRQRKKKKKKRVDRTHISDSNNLRDRTRPQEQLFPGPRQYAVS